MPSLYKKELEQVLKDLQIKLKGRLSVSEYQDCLIKLLFYRLFSERWHASLKKSTSAKTKVIFSKDYSFAQLVLFLREPSKLSAWQCLKNFYQKAQKQEKSSTHTFKMSQLFKQILHSAKRLGKDSAQSEELFKEILYAIAKLDWPFLDEELDLLSLTHEYFLHLLPSASVGKTADFYTPEKVAYLMAKLVCSACPQAQSVYDPCCGTAILLRQVAKESRKIKHFYAQEINPRSAYLAQLNLISLLGDLSYFHLSLADTLKINKAEWTQRTFDVILANPPFAPLDPNWHTQSLKIPFLPFESLSKVKRTESLFIAHMLFHLSQQGCMAILLPHGFLFRSGAEKQMRQELIEKYNYLDAVISLPAKLFYNTKIATVLLIFKKERRRKKQILFVEASQFYQKEKKQNTLTDQHVQHISELYLSWQEKPGLSRCVPIKELAKNSYNLSVSTYISQEEDLHEEDLESLQAKIQNLRAQRAELEALIAQECAKLKLSPPF